MHAALRGCTHACCTCALCTARRLRRRRSVCAASAQKQGRAPCACTPPNTPLRHWRRCAPPMWRWRPPGVHLWDDPRDGRRAAAAGASLAPGGSASPFQGRDPAECPPRGAECALRMPNAFAALGWRAGWRFGDALAGRRTPLVDPASVAGLGACIVCCILPTQAVRCALFCGLTSMSTVALECRQCEPVGSSPSDVGSAVRSSSYAASAAPAKRVVSAPRCCTPRASLGVTRCAVKLRGAWF